MTTGTFGGNVRTGQRESGCIVVESSAQPVVRSVADFTVGWELRCHVPFGIVILNLMARNTFRTGRSGVSQMAIGTLYNSSMTAGQLKSCGGMFEC